jgi:hypothetical protein
MDTHELIEKLTIIVRSAMFAVIKSHEIIFKEDKNNEIAIAYLNLALSHLATAKAIYYSRYDVLERYEVDELFHLFDVYAEELLSNYAEDHSHQWTDIEFIRLKEYFDNSVFAFNI